LTKTERKLAEILQILSIALFEQVPLQQVLTEIPVKNEAKREKVVACPSSRW
jgi:hypothetical protein